MGNYSLSIQAEDDLRRIWFYGLEHYGLARADAYFANFFVRFEQLANQPRLAPAVDDIRKGYRRAVCGADTIYYRINSDTIEIMRILGRQDTQEHL